MKIDKPPGYTSVNSASKKMDQPINHKHNQHRDKMDKNKRKAKRKRKKKEHWSKFS